MTRFPQPIFFLFVIAVALSAGRAQAELRIVLDDPNFEPVPIAVVSLFGETAEERQLGEQITEVVTNNLRSSGLFRPIDPQAFIQRDESLLVSPRFNEWNAIGAQLLLAGRVRVRINGDIRAEFRLWEIGENEMNLMLGQAIEVIASVGWRRLGHQVSDAVYQRLTGEGGYFDSRIVFVAESGPRTDRVKRLAIMDQDGANLRYLTDGNRLVLTPRFSPTSQEITYLAYVNNRPRVYLLSLETGRREIVGDFPGMTFAPRFSPDGNRVIMSLETDGNSEIYTLDLRTRSTRRLTNHPAIDTSPSFSPDGDRITFNSDRSGRQKIYVMNTDGSGVTAITNNPGRYATPVWSPRGDLIAFTKIEEGVFYIGVMRTDGSGERLLTRGFLVEGPTWSPNGRVLMYFKQERGGNPQLYSIDLTGRNERRIDTPTNASDPAWSPLLPQ